MIDSRSQTYLWQTIASMLPWHWGIVLCACILAWPCLSSLHSQPIDPALRISVQEDSREVHLYHTMLPSIGHGFNIYRKTETDSVFTQLNTDPIRGVSSGAELRAYLGTLYDDIERITDQSNANGTFTKLRSDIRTANLLSFTQPKVAEALGRIYIDRDAPLGEPVTYKLEFVDTADLPTNVELVRTQVLLPQRPRRPSRLRAQNVGTRITVFWQYPTTQNEVDNVIQFLVNRIDPATNQREQLNQQVILRNNALYEHSFTFEVPTTGQTEQLTIEAVDISGQSSGPSEILHFETLDTEPPFAVLDIKSRIDEGQWVQIDWTPSTKTDVAGYHLYRSTSLSDSSSYVRLNDTLLDVQETTYYDSLNVLQHGPRVFYYRVAAVDAHGNRGALSTATMAIVEDKQAPDAPLTLQGTFLEDGTVALEWTAADAQEDLATYIVLRHYQGKGAPSLPSRVNPEALTQTKLIDRGEAGLGFREGAYYSYSVISTDASGNYSKPTSTQIFIPDQTAPSPPGGAHALIDNNSRIVFLWNPSPSSDVHTYTVYRSEEGSARLNVASMRYNRLRFEDHEVNAGTSYAYWLTATDKAGNESSPSEVVQITMRDDTPPRHVRNVQVTADPADAFLISWEPVPSTDLAGYIVYRATSMTGLFTPLYEQPITSTNWTDNNPIGAAWYQVRAVDSSGNMSIPSIPAYSATSAHYSHQQ